MSVLIPDGDQLRYSGRSEVLTPDLLMELKRYKPALITLISTPPETHACSRCQRFAYPRSATICFWCASIPEARPRTYSRLEAEGALKEAPPSRPVFSRAGSGVESPHLAPKSVSGDAIGMQPDTTARQDNDLRLAAPCLHRRSEV